MFSIYFENKNNVVFWLSPKCGCTFLRKLYLYLTNSFNLHAGDSFRPYVADPEKKFTHVLFIRNPYKRIVSGYLDCYAGCKDNVKVLNEEMTFAECLHFIESSEFTEIDKLHFNYQSFIDDRHEPFEFNRIFDIESIDFRYLEELFGKPIDPKLCKALQNSDHKNVYLIDLESDLEEDAKPIVEAWNMTITELNDLDGYPSWDQFFNEELKALVEKVYRCDFEMFKSNFYNLEFPNTI